MKQAGSNLSIIYHVDIKFNNGKIRSCVYYNADNAKDAVRYFENKYAGKCTVTYYPEYV